MTEPATPADPSAPLTFDRVQLAAGATAAVPVCARCRTPITSMYYETHGQLVCSDCQDHFSKRDMAGRGTGPFSRAVLFGLGAAIAGAVLYYAVREATGLEIGLIAIAVGWMVGRAIQKATGGVGGRRYQILAVALTYLAMTSTYIPMLVTSIKNDRPSANSTASTRSTTDSTTAAATPPTSGIKVLGEIALALGLVLVLPILVNIEDMPGGILGLMILGFGLLQAWRMTKKTELVFTGPFKVAAAATPTGESE